MTFPVHTKLDTHPVGILWTSDKVVAGDSRGAAKALTICFRNEKKEYQSSYN